MLNNITIKIDELHTKSEKLLRGHGYTSNGYWIIKSEYETTHLKKRITTHELTKDMVDRLINHIEYAHPTPLTITDLKQNEFRGLNCTLTGTDGVERIVNAHFLKFLLQPGEVSLYGNSGGKFEPIIFKKDEEIIGILMPINTGR